MSMMGKISFFLGLQISQSPRGIFLNQSKYASEIVKKYGMETIDPVDTPMVEKSKLDEDPQGKAIDATRYRGMIGPHMYLTASRPDLVFVVCMCARHGSCRLSRYQKSTSRSLQLLGDRLHGISVGRYLHQAITKRKTIISHEKALNAKHVSGNAEKAGRRNLRVKVICLRLPDQEFDEPPSEEDILFFIKELGHTRNIKNITNMVVDHMHQPWRTFAAIINKCLSGKTTDRYKKQEKMYYSRFTKAIIYHFLLKDKSILMRSIMFMHTAQDDSILSILRFVSKDEDYQVYGALIPAVMTNPKIRDSPAYQTYLAFTTGAATLKPKRIYKKHDSPMIKTTTTSPEETIDPNE
ncbi:retrovirus-related pol polyprotein from transposon TNT 1-94 [Tanacetum coccineum]